MKDGLGVIPLPPEKFLKVAGMDAKQENCVNYSPAIIRDYRPRAPATPRSPSTSH